MDCIFTSFKRCLKPSITLLSILLCVSMSGCQFGNNNNNLQDLSFSTSYYYPKFLFVGERTDTVTKKLKYHFNSWAIQNESYVHLGLYDSNGNLIDKSNKTVSVIVNGVKNTSGRIDLKSKADSIGQISISLTFSPNTKTTNYGGYIKFINGDLDRINNITALNGAPAFSWSATQEVIWNPLKKYSAICFLVSVAFLLIWLIILRPIIYTRFKRGSLTIQSPFFKNMHLNNLISLTLSEYSKQQNWKQKLFRGKEYVYVHPFFVKPIRITPHSKNKIRIQLDPAYSIHPFATTLEKGKGQYIITNLATKEKINLTYG